LAPGPIPWPSRGAEPNLTPPPRQKKINIFPEPLTTQSSSNVQARFLPPTNRAPVFPVIWGNFSANTPWGGAVVDDSIPADDNFGGGNIGWTGPPGQLSKHLPPPENFPDGDKATSNTGGTEAPVIRLEGGKPRRLAAGKVPVASLGLLSRKLLRGWLGGGG